MDGIRHRARPLAQPAPLAALPAECAPPSVRSSAEANLRWLASITHSAGAALIAMTPSGEITSWNQGAEQLFGHTGEDAIGKPFALLVPARALEESAGLEWRTVGVRRDGSRLDVHVKLVEIADADGAITGILAIVRDLTEQKHSEEKIRGSQTLFRQIVESIGEVFRLVDTSLDTNVDTGEGRVVYASPAFEKIWGRSCESLYEDPGVWMSAVHPADRTRAEARYAEQLAGAGSSQDAANEYRIVRPDGSVRYVRDRVSVVRDDAGAARGIAGVTEDITSRRESDDALAASEFRFRRLVESDLIGVFKGDKTGRIFDANQNFLDILGYSGRDLERGAIRVEGVAGAAPVETSLPRKDGTGVPTLLGLSPLDGESAIGFLLDLSKQKAAEEGLRRSEERFRQFAENIREVLWLIDASTGELLYVSPAFEGIWQRSRDALYSDTDVWLNAIHPDDRLRAEEIFRRQLNGEPLDSDYRIVQPSGAVRWIRGRSFPVHDAAGRVIRVGGVSEDITDRKLHEASMTHQASRDQLTNLANRRLLLERLQIAIASRRQAGDLGAVFFIDLDRFKLVNDSMGHSAGDQMLREVAARLQSVTREADTLARIGGDEFTLVVAGFENKQAVDDFGHRVLDCLKPPFRIGARELFMGASIGVSLFPGDGDDPDTLQRNADTAVREAKRAGKGQLLFFSPRMAEDTRQRLALETELRGALRLNEFRLQFQPQFAQGGEQLVRFEALIRWYPAAGGPVAPDRFIPIAEENGLIVPIGRWVLGEACRCAADWQRGARRGIGVAVNVSAREFARADFVAGVEQTLKESTLPARLLELELTESVFIADVEDSARKLTQLRAVGVTVALDDFGTGYSSLSYLRNLAIDVVKIDRSFLTATGQKDGGEAVLRCVIELAHALGIRVIGEGVETPAQLDLLRRLGCDEMQGFLLGRPAFELARPR
jgi:diguanylate cyclase (GGDEF)-like protein/PAS domain S-box-containing protein